MSDLHILRLEPYDDAISVRDRLSFADARYVLLVWPDDAPRLQRKLDLLLIQRQAARLGMHLAVVTHDPAVIGHAHDLNLSVFPDEKTARRGRWKRPRNRVFLTGRDPAAQAALAEQIVQHRTESLRSAAWQRWSRVIRWGAFVALLVAMVAGFLLIAPSATVTLTPANDQVFVRVPITTDPALTDIDIEGRRIPASVIPLQASSHVTVQSSGRETAGTTQAQGLAVFTNTTGQAMLIPLGTVIATGGTFPIRFETTLETTLPAGEGAEVEVPIQALPEHAGVGGNVNPNAINRIEGALSGLVTVSNPNATYGGSIQERAVVTADDHARLLVLARQQVLQRARDELLHRLSGDQFLIPGSIRIVQERPEWTLYSAIVGDLVDSVSLDMRAEVEAIVVDERQAQQIAYAGLAPYVQPGLEVASENLTFTRGEIQQMEPGGHITFLMIVEGNVAVSIDPDRVRRRLAGTSLDEARHRLERDLLLDPGRPPQITTWPGWFRRLPWLPVRITVQVQTP